MPTEHTTVIVSVNTEWDEETRMEHVNAQVEDGWRVASVTPISGGGTGPGGASEDFLRLQVILARDVDAENTVVRDRGDDVPGARPEEASRTAGEAAGDFPGPEGRAEG